MAVHGTDSGIFSKRQYFFKMTKHKPACSSVLLLVDLELWLSRRLLMSKKVWAAGQWQLKFFLVPFKLG